MNVYQKADGSVLYSGREYDVAAATALYAGQVVTLSEGLVTAAAQKQTGAVLGVAAETHSGVPDALNPRNDGKRVLVLDAPDLIFSCDAPRITASSGSATTIVSAGIKDFSADDFNGGYVKLLSKAEGSTNTDELGCVRRITDFAASGGAGTLTVESGGTPASGDVYLLFPPVGFAKGQLDAQLQKLDLGDTCALAMKVVGADRAQGKVWMMAKSHVLANS